MSITPIHVIDAFLAFENPLPSINNQGRVVFVDPDDFGYSDELSGLQYRHRLYTGIGGQPQLLTDYLPEYLQGDEVPPAINDAGTVAFIGMDRKMGDQSPSSLRVYASTGELTMHLDTSYNYDGYQFSKFDEVALDNHGRVAFIARRDDGRRGIYTLQNGVIDTVFERQFVSGGASVRLANIAINDSDEIIFTFNDSIYSIADASTSNREATLLFGRPDGYRLTVNNVEISEPPFDLDASAVFNVRLGSTQYHAWPITVRYATQDLTASAGSDYVSQVGELVFMPGENEKTITVPIKYDGDFEFGDEAFQLRFFDPSGDLLPYLVLPTPAVATIQDRQPVGDDDDRYLLFPRLSANPASVLEGSGAEHTVTINVNLQGAHAGPVTVHYETQDLSARAGQDFVAASGTLRFEPGDSSEQISIRIIADQELDGGVHLLNERFWIRLDDPTNTRLDTAIIEVEIRDDERLMEVETDVRMDVNSSGVAVFAVRDDSYNAIMTSSNGKLEVFVDSLGPYKDLGHPDLFGGLGKVGINNAGDILFHSSLDIGGYGIFTGPDPAADKIVTTGDVLNGEIVRELYEFADINDDGAVTFSAKSGGTVSSPDLVGIYRTGDYEETNSQGLTIITHGFSLTGSFPGWASRMGAEIIERAGAGRIINFDFVTGAVRPAGEVALAARGETVVVFDWAEFSNNTNAALEAEPGWREAAGDLLANFLLGSGLAQSAHDANAPIHFIGHSFGTVVISEAIRRLGYYGINVDQMTTLDPHDFDQEHLPDARHDPAVTVWSNVKFADNYWEDNVGSAANPRDGVVGLILPVGRPIDNAHNRNLTAETAPIPTETADQYAPHSRVHEWYFQTILARLEGGIGKDPMAPEWFPKDASSPEWFPVNNPLSYGYVYSASGGRSRPPSGGGAAIVEPPSIFNGDFSYHEPDNFPYTTNDLPGYLRTDDPNVIQVPDDHGFVAALNETQQFSDFVHRPIYIAPGVAGIYFEYNVRAAFNGARLSTSLIGPDGTITQLPQISLSGPLNAWKSIILPIPAALTQESNWQSFRVAFENGGPGAQVLVDNFRLSKRGDYDRNGRLDRSDYNFWQASFGAFVDAATGSDGSGNGKIDAADYVVWRNNIFSPPPNVLGDYDVDGIVDHGDYEFWQMSYGLTVSTPGLGADGNNDGLVNAADYVLWRMSHSASNAPLAAIALPSEDVFSPESEWDTHVGRRTNDSLPLPGKSTSYHRGFPRPLLRQLARTSFQQDRATDRLFALTKLKTSEDVAYDGMNQNVIANATLDAQRTMAVDIAFANCDLQAEADARRTAWFRCPLP